MFLKSPEMSSVFGVYKGRMVFTWILVLIENALIALIPLLIGFCIDGLLQQEFKTLYWFACVLLLLGGIAVGRRFYDTRVFGAIRVALGVCVHRQSSARAPSMLTARIDMSRELIDFLEVDLPELMTSVIQVFVSLAVLSIYDLRLGVSSVLVISLMVVWYSLFHRRFFDLNGALNKQMEQQVFVLNIGKSRGLFKHLAALRKHEISISDTEAIVYGGIFVLQILYILSNLYQGTMLPDITAGMIFSIVTYSWEFVEAALAIPIALQSWSRLSEIIQRLNSNSTENVNPLSDER